MLSPRRTDVVEAILSRFKTAQEQLVLQTADLPLATLADMVETRTIDLDPNFQRRERWSHDKQSALIESFILNVPVPPIYLSEDEYGKYTAIDGKQRLRTICDYLYGRFKLRNLEGFREIEGLSFNELPDPIRNALRIRPFLRVVTLLKQSNAELKYEVFTRLNRGGETLNPQELRNVVFRGPLNDVIYQLADTDFLRSRLKIRNNASSAFRNMQDVEFVLRFLTLSERRTSYSGSLLRSMDEFMLTHRDAQPSFLANLRERFGTALARCQSLWGTYAFRRPEGAGWRDQTLAGMYDAEMLAVVQIDETIFKNAAVQSQDVIAKTRLLFDDPQFEQAVRLGTNTPSRIDYRVSKVVEMLSEYQ
jgi:hypothetical protein